MIWFLYIDESDILKIGSLNKYDWDNLGQIDSLDLDYQKKIDESLVLVENDDVNLKGRIRTTTISETTVFFRDPALAVARFKKATWSCEINSTHETFISARTNLPFVEAHHFIPIKFQPLFPEPLDCLDNIVALCPTCHRAIHHATSAHKFNMIKNLYNIRPHLQNNSVDNIAQFYNCIPIT